MPEPRRRRLAWRSAVGASVAVRRGAAGGAAARCRRGCCSGGPTERGPRCGASASGVDAHAPAGGADRAAPWAARAAHARLARACGVQASPAWGSHRAFRAALEAPATMRPGLVRSASADRNQGLGCGPGRDESGRRVSEEPGYGEPRAGIGTDGDPTRACHSRTAAGPAAGPQPDPQPKDRPSPPARRSRRGTPRALPFRIRFHTRAARGPRAASPGARRHAERALPSGQLLALPSA